MKVRCNNPESLRFLRLLPQEEMDELRGNTCWQQIELITPKFKEEVLLTEVRLLLETYLDYILKSSDKNMEEVEEQLDQLEEMLNLKGKLPSVYRSIVERCMGVEGKEEIKEILQALRELRKTRERKKRKTPTRSRKPTKGKKCRQPESMASS